MSERAPCRKTSNESVRKPAAILKAQRGDRPVARYALQTSRPAPRLRAGAPAYWFGRSPKLVVILLLGPLLLLFFRELRLLRLLAGKGWGWKLFVFMMTRRAFFAAEAVLNFLLASRKLLSHAETLIKKGEQNSGSTTGYSFWDGLWNYLHELFCQFTNLVNSGKFMVNCWSYGWYEKSLRRSHNY